ncbi:hypothetical protein FRX31_027106 [Thalictrum thalictroides]|uniref:Uncharacterized protein n=1 Tax=Thalictrum thalictroides TaxID=46969 RepID=A0A7J6VEY3_THATH|nr:hypothetical protein FRX31_027106 [Thalictrum thalictroides]
MKSAVEKFRSMGANAPYCNLMYPPEDLLEFKSERIRILTNIAHDIATIDGRSTLNNLRRVGTNPLSPSMVATVRRIISLYSGAITPSVAHARVGGFARLDMHDPLANVLNSDAKDDDETNGAVDNPTNIPGTYTLPPAVN